MGATIEGTHQPIQKVGNLTVLQEQHAWEIFETCYESRQLGNWARNFLRDNRRRFSEDPTYFISPKMNTIMNQMYDVVTKD